MRTMDETIYDWYKDHFKPLLDKYGIRHTGREIDALKRYVKDDTSKLNIKQLMKYFKGVK